MVIRCVHKRRKLLSLRQIIQKNTQREEPSLVIRKIRTKRASLGKVNNINVNSIGE